MSKQQSTKQKRGCLVPKCTNPHHGHGYCKKHLRQKYSGKLIIEETLPTRKKLIKEVAEKGSYHTSKVAQAGTHSKYIIDVHDADTLSVKEDKSDFISRDGNMKLKEIMEKDNLTTAVDPKYFVFASVVTQWAINSKDCIVRCPYYNGGLPATDEMIRKEFSKYTQGAREMSDRYFNRVMKHLTERNIIFKMPISNLGIISYQYLANPLFVPSVLNELSTTLFLAFHDAIARKIDNHKKMNEMFSLCLKNTAWSQECIDLELKGDKKAADNIFISNLINLVKELGIESRVRVIDNSATMYERIIGLGKTMEELEKSRKQSVKDIKDDSELEAELDASFNEEPKLSKGEVGAVTVNIPTERKIRTVTMPDGKVLSAPLNKPKKLDEANTKKEITDYNINDIYEEEPTAIPEQFRYM